MLKSFMTKLAMLALFLLAVTCGWAAVTMVFPASLFNILLGIVSAFFLLRAFELADKVNKLGPYADPGDREPDNDRPGPRFRSPSPDDGPDEG